MTTECRLDETGDTPEKVVTAPQQFSTVLGFSLAVDPNDFIAKLLARDGWFELPESELVSRLVRPGDTCIDAGCQVGYYSCLLAKLTGPAGKVFAFDANPSACECTRENLARNGLTWAEVTHAALGDSEGSTQFYLATEDQTGLSSLGKIAAIRSVITVPWLRLDDFLDQRKLKRVRLLKLDVEGAEELVLRGVHHHLERQKIDFILIECFDERLEPLRSSAEQLSALLLKAGYRAWSYNQDGCGNWLPAGKVVSRGDSSYLFATPEACRNIPKISLAGALQAASAEVQTLKPICVEVEALEKRRREIAELEERSGSQLRLFIPAEPPSFSPGRALWNQRQKLAAMAPRIAQLSAAVDSPGELALYQWAQLTAVALEFQPDLIMELGRRRGNSTACFLESIWEMGGGELVSLCLDPLWETSTAPKLRKLRPGRWFAPGKILRQNILDFDFAAALSRSRRCLVFWDAHGFEVADCVLGGLMPILGEREHLVLMHDMSDLRFTGASARYGSSGLWRGESAGEQSLFLGPLFSRVAQAISMVDFATRNQLPLHSADESLATEIAGDPEKVNELRALLGPELAELQGHWLWFTLHEAQGEISFPAYSAPEAMRRFQRSEAMKRMETSMSWAAVQRWQNLLSRVAPEGTLRRSAYRFVSRPLRALLRR